MCSVQCSVEQCFDDGVLCAVCIEKCAVSSVEQCLEQCLDDGVQTLRFARC